MIISKPKPKKCQNKGCPNKFIPQFPMQQGCSIDCRVTIGIEAAKKLKAKKAASDRKAKAEEKRADKEKLESLKTPKQKRSDLIQKAEKSVRDYRRAFELMRGSGCISCGRSQKEAFGTDGWKPGGAFDAGHYHSKGARPNLRMEPDNIWLQCKSCNAGSSKYARKGAVVSKQYRENLIKEIGLSRVEELDADDKARHWSEEELIEIDSIYKLKLKELKNGR